MREASMALLIDPQTIPWENWNDSEAVRMKMLLSAGVTQSDQLTLGLASVEPGEEIERHHHEQAEIYIVLTGEGECEVDGTEYPLDRGRILFIPAGAPHRTINTGDEQLLFLFAFAADAHDDVRYMFPGEEQETGEHDLQAVNDPELTNPDATPGTGMLPDVGSNDPNSSPSG